MDNNNVALYIRRKEMLIEVLQHLGCYDEYIRNYGEFHLIDKEQVLDNVMHRYQSNNKHNPFFHIFCCEFSYGGVSFIWSGTPEGNDYWSDGKGLPPNEEAWAVEEDSVQNRPVEKHQCQV